MTFLASMPSVVASLRCVLEHEKSLGLGLQSIILRLIGSIPGPVCFGYFLDKACFLWEPNCGKFLIVIILLCYNIRSKARLHPGPFWYGLSVPVEIFFAIFQVFFQCFKIFCNISRFFATFQDFLQYFKFSCNISRLIYVCQ